MFLILLVFALYIINRFLCFCRWTFSDPTKPRVCACEECKKRDQGLISEQMRPDGDEEEKNRALFQENQQKTQFHKDLEGGSSS